jgi:N6-L-threonylcarbamoyladenine synthase
VVSSSLALHRKFGGIIPEIAFRKQLETISGVVDCALSEARSKIKDIDCISVTSGPGLLGSLLVGISFAKGLSLARGIPLVGVNHLHAHIYAAFLDKSIVAFPFVALIVSGGHTNLYWVKDFSDITLLGSTLDDACGEAFDKVSRILGLGYPGGPAIEKAARSGKPGIRFGCSAAGKEFDFSYSGIKTAVLYYVKKNLSQPKNMRKKQLADICASFQDAALSVLVEKTLAACRQKRCRRLVIGGGVAANSVLRAKLESACLAGKISLSVPEKSNCMDNAAMVAGLGGWLFAKGRRSDLLLNAQLKERGG